MQKQNKIDDQAQKPLKPKPTQAQQQQWSFSKNTSEIHDKYPNPQNLTPKQNKNKSQKQINTFCEVDKLNLKDYQELKSNQAKIEYKNVRQKQSTVNSSNKSKQQRRLNQASTKDYAQHQRNYIRERNLTTDIINYEIQHKNTHFNRLNGKIGQHYEYLSKKPGFIKKRVLNKQKQYTNIKQVVLSTEPTSMKIDKSMPKQSSSLLHQIDYFDNIQQHKTPQRSSSIIDYYNKISHNSRYESPKNTPNPQNRLIMLSQRISHYITSRPDEGQLIDFVISNISVNFHKKIFGKKRVELNLFPYYYCTEDLHGNHLLWVGKGYLFRKINPLSEMIVYIKVKMEQEFVTAGKIKILISQMLMNFKECYYRTYLFNPSNNEEIGVLVLGFETYFKQQLITGNSPKCLPTPNDPSAEPVKKTPIKLKKMHMKRMRHAENSKRIKINESLLEQNCHQKYKGGRNIKIGHQERFPTNLRYHSKPGPGSYKTPSIFSRYHRQQIF